jgi:hypothetical protein
MKQIERELYTYGQHKRRAEELEAQIREVMDKKEALADKMLQAMRWEETKVRGGPRPDPVFAAVQRMVDTYGARIDAIRMELTDIYERQDGLARTVAAAALLPAEREYVELRYFGEMRPAAVAVKMNYSENYLRNIKIAALNKIEAVRKR